jgi:hypothetical protein
VKELEYEYDKAMDVFTVEGIRYSGELLRTGLQTRPDTLLRIVKNEDGIVVVQSYRVNLEDFERWHQRWIERHANL